MTRIDEINAILDGLGEEATYDETEYALRDYPTREVQNVLADRQLAGGDAVEVPVLSTRVALTDAQIKALPSTPVELVAAPGAGKTILVVGSLVIVDNSNNGYDNISATAYALLTFTGEDSGAAQGLLANVSVSDLLSSFSRTSVNLGPYSVAAVDVTVINPALIDVGDMENKALQLKVNNQGLGNFTEGDAANSGSCTVLYMIVDL